MPGVCFLRGLFNCARDRFVQSKITQTKDKVKKQLRVVNPNFSLNSARFPGTIRVL